MRAHRGQGEQSLTHSFSMRFWWALAAEACVSARGVAEIARKAVSALLIAFAIECALSASKVGLRYPFAGYEL